MKSRKMKEVKMKKKKIVARIQAWRSMRWPRLTEIKRLHRRIHFLEKRQHLADKCHLKKKT
jgi:hypothetical protein